MSKDALITPVEGNSPLAPKIVHIQGIELEQPGSWGTEVNAEASKTINTQNGSIEISVIINFDARDKTDLTTDDLDSVYMGLDLGSPQMPDERRAEIVTGIGKHNPGIGLTIARVGDETKLYVAQSSPIPDSPTRSHWQCFTLMMNPSGKVIYGCGSAETFDDISDRHGTEAPFRDIEPTWGEGENYGAFVSIDFGTGPIGKLLRKIGLPTKFSAGDQIIDPAGNNLLTFGTIALQMVQSGIESANIKALLQPGDPQEKAS